MKQVESEKGLLSTILSSVSVRRRSLCDGPSRVERPWSSQTDTDTWLRLLVSVYGEEWSRMLRVQEEGPTRVNFLVNGHTHTCVHVYL